MRKALQVRAFRLVHRSCRGRRRPSFASVPRMRILRAPERQKGVAVGRSVRSVVAAWGRLAFWRGGRVAESQVSLPAGPIDGARPRFTEPGCDLGGGGVHRAHDRTRGASAHHRGEATMPARRGHGGHPRDTGAAPSTRPSANRDRPAAVHVDRREPRRRSTEALAASQQNVSKHAGVLAQADIIAGQKDGNRVRCSIADQPVFAMVAPRCIARRRSSWRRRAGRPGRSCCPAPAS